MSFFLSIRPSQLVIAISACLGVSIAHAAGLEYSQQPIAPFFEKGNYAEVSYAHVTPKIEGKDALGNKVDNMMEAYSFTGAAVKVAPSENTALALFYNQPWGVDTVYPKGNLFHNDLGQTEAKVNTDAIGVVVGGKVTDNVWLYGGVEHQSLSGKVTAATPLGVKKATLAVLAKAGVTGEQYAQLMQGQKAGVLNNTQKAQLKAVQTALANNVPALAQSSVLYTLDFEDDTTLVPMVGIAYEKPEIEMRTSLTYRAPAKYDLKAKENVQVAVDPTSNISDYSGVIGTEFPQSISLDFQTGLSEKHQLLGMVNARWVDWSEFEVNPPLSAQSSGEALARYDEDQYSVEVALAKKFTPKFAAEIRASYDSGTGASLSALGPYNSVKGLAIGAQYDLTDQITVGGGAQYVWIEGGEVSDRNDNKVMTIDDSSAYAFGMKVGYHF